MIWESFYFLTSVPVLLPGRMSNCYHTVYMWAALLRTSSAH